jgi:hypothetical protein
VEADEKKCPQCAETVKAEAKICRFCGHTFETAQPPETRKPETIEGKAAGWGKGCLIVLGVLVALSILGALISPADRDRDVADPPAALASDNAATPENLAAAEAVAAANPADSDAPSAIGLIGAQANARRSAEQYLSMTGFSRKGLIEQLSSDAGDGYDLADATAAVDSLTVDWNEQAVRSAKQYTDMMGFSCSGLVEQLSSDAGSGYTDSQARFGAEQVGAC